MQIDADQLKRQTTDILATAGARQQEAELVADQLVDANLAGHDSHGVVRLPRYLKAMERGEINVHSEVRAATELPAGLVLDGDWAFGQVAAAEALDRAAARAKTQGVCYAGVFNCNDVGRLGWYTTRAAEHGFAALMTINDGGANPHVAPWGGTTPLLSTNPISAAFPAGNTPPVCLDLATSICAGGKIQIAQKRGEALPAGLLLDAKGKPSTRPEDLFTSPPGSLLPLGAPMAGHKGYALSLMVDILSGALSGAGCSGSGGRDAQGVFLLVMNIEALAGMPAFAARVEALGQTLKSVPRAEGVDEILLPGEPESRARQQRSGEGVFIEDATWREIITIARELGVKDLSK